MLYGRTDDHVEDFNRHDHEKSKVASRLPICVHCKKPINDDEYFDIDGDYKCYECMIKHHRRWTEDYVN